ncbi:MAG: histone deacetylase, partial [Chitinophagales bacterium]
MLKIAWSPVYAHSLPPRHRFPMEKYTLLPEQLRYEGTVTSDNFFIPTPLSEKYIINTHDQVYWHKLKNLQLSRKEERATGFPLSKALIHREIVIAQGTVTATEYALQHGVAMNIAGGTHHAFTNKGEGFCLLNDIAIAANYALEHYHFRQILVIDLDVHQGNGTAEIFQFQPKVFTFSMHGAKNYPLRKEKSDLDIGLPDKTGDDIYLPILAETLNTLFHQLQPDLVYFQAGVDVLATDQLGRLALSLQGCRQRDELVLTKCCQHRI